jgi:RNA-directed DNA polymerase
MRKALIGLQDLRRILYVKAKADPTWRSWGLYVPCLQDGDALRGLPDGERKRRGARN